MDKIETQKVRTQVPEMRRVKRIHFIGIGGAGMSGIAEVLVNEGYEITGSDINSNPVTEHLKSLGATIFIGHDANNVKGASVVVISSAIKKKNPELVAAKELRIPIVKRAEMLAELMRYRHGIAIAGTHGKTTTSSMVSCVFVEKGLDPSIQIGANLTQIGGNYRVGKSDYFIIEACEYKDSFQNFKQRSAIITNIDNDHLDYFKNIDNISKTFEKYVSKLPEDGVLVLNMDNARCYDLRNYTKANVITVSENNKEADYYTDNITYDDRGCPSYDIYRNDELVTRVSLNVRGEHNVLNSLEAFALCSWYGIDTESIVKGLASFTGASRRMEYKGKFNGANVYDDYGHHPTEIEATSNAILKEKHNESYAIFEAHTYSRAVEHMDSFVESLRKFDHIIVIDIYAAREENIYGVKPEDIVEKLVKRGKDAVYISDYDEIKKYLSSRVKEGDLIITIGAGNVTKVASKLVED